MIKVVGKLSVFLVLLIAVGVTLIYAMDYRTSHRRAAEPERFVVYAATADEGPTFSLSDGGTTLRILSFLHLRNRNIRSVYNPNDRYVYGLKFEVRENESVITTKEVWFQTRKSKRWNDEKGQVEQPSYYPPGTLGEPSDPRLLDVDLSRFSGSGRTVTVTVVSSMNGIEEEVNLMAFRSFDRNDETIEEYVERRPKKTVRLNDSRSGIRRWSTLTSRELRESLRSGWRRKTTLVEAPSRVLFTTDFDLTIDGEEDVGQVIEAGAGNAINIRGPATFGILPVDAVMAGRDVSVSVERLSAKTDALVPTVGANTETFSMKSVSPYQALSSTVREHKATILTVADGDVETIIVRPSELGRLLLYVDRAAAVVGETPMKRFSGTSFSVAPDIKKLSFWSLKSETRYATSLSDVRIGDAIRLEFRRRTPKPAVVRYRFEGTDVSGEISLASGLSFVDRFSIQVGDIEQSSQATKPDVARFMIPEGATALVVEGTEEDVWVSASFVELLDETIVAREAPYADPALGVRWRYAPFLTHPWYRVFPDDAEEREKRNERGTLLAQVRWEPTVPGVPFSESFDIVRRNDLTRSGFATETPRRRRASVIYEPTTTPGDGVRLDDTWRFQIGGSSSTCRAGRNSKLNFFIRREDVGGTLRIYWNDEIIRQQIARTTRGTIRLPVSGIGKLSVKYESVVPGANVQTKFFTTCRSAAATAWRLRKIYPVNDRIDVPVSHDGESTKWVNAVIYNGSGTVRTMIDNGDPKMAAGVVSQVTRPIRTYDVEGEPNRTFRVDSPWQTLSGPTRFSVPISKDWRAGKHLLSLSPTSPDTSGMWVRFFSRN